MWLPLCAHRMLRYLYSECVREMLLQYGTYIHTAETCDSVISCNCSSLSEEKQQINPRVPSAIKSILREWKWAEGSFPNDQLSWRFEYTGTPLITIYASGILEGEKIILNHGGKQKIGKTDVVVLTSRQNLIICCLTSSIHLRSWLMTSVLAMYFKAELISFIPFWNTSEPGLKNEVVLTVIEIILSVKCFGSI